MEVSRADAFEHTQPVRRVICPNAFMHIGTRVGRTLTLRARVLALMVILLTSVSLVVGAATIATYRSASIERLGAAVDDALSRATLAIENAPSPEYMGPITPSLVLRIPGQQAGTLAALRTRAGDVQAGLIGAGGELVDLSRALAERLAHVPADGTAHRMDLAELGSYVVIATQPSAMPDVDVVVALPAREVDSATMHLSLTVAATVSLALLIGVGLGTVLIRHALRPLTQVAALAERVSRLPLGQAGTLLAENAESGDERTEVGRLSAAVHRMFGRISSALSERELSERRTRRFVADASHELRTPLASIRGYAEFGRIYDIGLTSQARTALARIEDEAIRMAALVDKLLLLARLDAGQELDFQQLDACSIVLEAAGSESQRAPDHDWQIQIPDGSALVEGDATRLKQAVTELLSNAHVHTPAGTAVRVVVSQDRSLVHLVVSDDGPGIDASLAGSVFGRFVRADQARNRSSGATGLGLSLATSIAEAHGGTLDLVNGAHPTSVRLSIPRSDQRT